MRAIRFLFVSAISLILIGSLSFFGFQRDSASSETPEVLFERGLRGIRDRDTAEVNRAIAGLKTVENFQDHAQLLRGAIEVLSDQPAAALREFAPLNPEGPLRAPLLLLTGEALYRMGQLAEAEECLVQAIHDHPDDVDALRWLATVSYDLGEIDQTIQTLHEVSRVAPTDYRPYHMQGVIYREFGEHLKAIPVLVRALELASQPAAQTEIRQMLAASQAALKQFDAALLTLHDCPESPESLSLAADCLWQSGQLKAAEEQLAQAEALGELPSAARKLKARMRLEKNDLDGASELLESSLKSNSLDDETHYLLALVCRRRKDEPGYQVHNEQSESIKALKDKLTLLSQKAMEEPLNAAVRHQLATICDQLELKPMAQVWRTAAANCQKRLSPVAPPEQVMP